MSERQKSLCESLGGHDSIVAIAADLLGTLREDPQPGRFNVHPAEQREVADFVQSFKRDTVEC